MLIQFKSMKLLAIVALATVAAAGIPHMFMGRPKGGFTSHLHENVHIDPALLAAGDIGGNNITQKLDHFDAANAKTWQQPYIFNHLYARDDSNLNILYIAGESQQQWGIGAIVGLSKAYVYYAQQLNADLYLLEHRFYGGSEPTVDTSVENLKYLSSQQAIEDIAEFIRQINTKKGTPQKWITVGGSYAGSLSAWSRLLHPELISGSISSSAPILAQMDFYGYLQTVDDDFKGENELCYSQLGAGLEKARQMLMTEEGRANLTDIFKIFPPLSAFDGLSQYDKDNFFGYLIGSFMYAAQTGNLTLECELFTKDGPDADPVEAFAVFGTRLDVNFTDSLRWLSDVEYNENTGSRAWVYQTCAEFGYSPSSNRGTNVFGETQSSNTFIEYCVRLFGIGADQIQKSIDYTNQYYGGRDLYAGTNVVFTHGSQDPWSSLTKKSDPKHESIIIMEVEGGIHCQDIGLSCLAPGMPECTESMKQIQTTTLAQMRRWIDPTIIVPDRIEKTDNVGKRPNGFDPIALPQSQASSNAPASTKIRAERTASKSVEESSSNLDYATVNRLTRIRRRIVPPPPLLADDVPTELVGTAYFEQTWDHFNPDEKRTFKQKWNYNYKYGSNDGPNFLMIGGEGPESINWVKNEGMAWMTYAKEVGANAFDLEHRYYGESKLGTNDLQYLSSSQALYDVATFIKTQRVNQKLTGPWITFGGSYPGALAAWSREWFPELILGAVGSSGPVQAKNDFYEYLEVVEDVLKRQSQKCYDRTREAFAMLDKLVQNPDGRATIQAKFKLLPKWTSDPDQIIAALDINNVFSALYGLFQGTVQYNDVAWNDVTKLCAFFEDDSVDSFDALSNLRFDATLGYGALPLSSNYMVDLKALKLLENFVDGHSKLFSDDIISNILWTWQTCNEFGYYQTTDYGEGIFGTPVPLNYFIVMCEQLFDMGMDEVTEGISRTLRQYGGRSRYNTTNVVLPNGDGDPWHALGIVEQGNLDDSVVPILIKGTSHCADMNPAKAADPAELTQARNTILANIKMWLANAPPPVIDTTTATVVTTSSARSSTTPASAVTSETTRTAPTTSDATKSTATTSSTVSTTTSAAAYSSTLLVALGAFLFATM